MLLQRTVLVAVLALSSTTAFSQSPAATVAKAREAHAKHSPAVVSIAGNLTLDISQMGEQESPIALLGTIVDPSGLVLTSLAALNPLGEKAVTVEPQPGMEVSISARVSDLWVDLVGGQRIQMEIALSDPLNDIALLRPKKEEEAKELGKRSLSADPASQLPTLLDEVVILGRTSEVANRVATVRISHVGAVVETPRACVLVEGPVGSPVFNATGQIVGVVTTLSSSDSVDPMAMLMGGGAGGGEAVVSLWSTLTPIIAQVKSSGSSEPKGF